MRTGLVIICCLFALSCGKANGQFGFKTEFDDIFRRPLRMPEIDTNKKTEWVYSFDSDFSRRDINIIIMKKELGWIEIAAYKDYVGMGKRTIGGVIEEYEPGLYRIQLVDSLRKKTIDSIVFTVYSENEENNVEYDKKY